MKFNFIQLLDSRQFGIFFEKKFIHSQSQCSLCTARSSLVEEVKTQKNEIKKNFKTSRKIIIEKSSYHETLTR